MRKSAKLLAIALLLGSFAHAATIVTVNGNKISTEEVDKVLMEGTQGRYTTLPPEKQNELRTRILEGLIAQDLIFEDAQKKGVLKSKEYKEELDAIIERIKKQLAAKVWEEQVFDSIAIPNAEIKNYYKNHPEEFVEKEKVKARHILVKTDKEAEDIIKQLKGLKGEKLKEKFIELAQKYSTGPSGPNGGDLGWFPQGQMVPEFNDAVFNMKVGTITTKPIKTQFGYHIIYLEDKKVGKKLPFEEVQNFIDQKLKMEKFKEVMEAKMKKLKDKAKIVYSKEFQK